MGNGQSAGYSVTSVGHSCVCGNVCVSMGTCTDVWWLARLVSNNEIKSHAQKKNETCTFRPYIHNEYDENICVCRQSISLRRLKNRYDEIKERDEAIKTDYFKMIMKGLEG